MGLQIRHRIRPEFGQKPHHCAICRRFPVLKTCTEKGTALKHVIDTLNAAGIHLSRDPTGTLRAGPAGAVTPELAALIREHRAARRAALAPPPDPADVREFYEERAAIFEYEADQPRAAAEAAALRRTLEHFHLPDPGAGGIEAAIAALTARRADPSTP